MHSANYLSKIYRKSRIIYTSLILALPAFLDLLPGVNASTVLSGMWPSVLFFLICGIGGSLSCQSRDAHSLTITLKMQTLFLCLFLFFGLGSSEIGLVEFQEENTEDCEVLVQVCIFVIPITIFVEGLNPLWRCSPFFAQRMRAFFIISVILSTHKRLIYLY